MAYSVSYSGSNMDTILAKALNFEAQDEAWVVIPSEITTLDISKVRHSGNYVYTGNLSLPDMDQLYGYKTNTAQAATMINCTCMIFVRYINHTIYQFISTKGIQDNSDKTMGIAWINNTPKAFFLSEETNTMMTIVTNESADKGIHKFNNQIRVFKDTKMIKYYDAISQSYKQVILDMMPKSIYNDVSNFFSFVDINVTQKYAKFKTHTQQSDIHTTSADKTTYNSKYRSDLLESDINTWKTTFLSEFNTQVSNLKSTITAIHNKTSNYSTTLSNHNNNTTLHPTQSRITSWDNKANAVHTHTTDEITIDAAKVTGKFTIEQIPDIAKERMTVVNSISEMLTLTSSSVQVGDWVFVNDSEYPLLFTVIDDTNLTSLSGYVQLTPQKPELVWGNVQNKPTTYDELNITNDMKNSEVEDLISDLNAEISITQSSIDDLSSNLSYYSEDRVKSTHTLESSIDIADQKMNVLYNVTSIPEMIVSVLEQILV